MERRRGPGCPPGDECQGAPLIRTTSIRGKPWQSIENFELDKSALLWAAALVLGSACGELLTVLFVVREMAIQGSMPWIVVLVMQILLIVVSIVLVVIVIRRFTGALGSAVEVSIIP